MLEKFERQVDPDGVLPPAERACRAENARKAFYLRMALQSAKVRRAKAGPRPQPLTIEERLAELDALVAGASDG